MTIKLIVRPIEKLTSILDLVKLAEIDIVNDQEVWTVTYTEEQEDFVNARLNDQHIIEVII